MTKNKHQHKQENYKVACLGQCTLQKMYLHKFFT